MLVSGSSPPKIDGVGHYTRRLAERLAGARPDWNVGWLSRRPARAGLPVRRANGVWWIRPAHTWSMRGRLLASAAARVFGPDLVHVQEETHSFHETDAALSIARAAPTGRLVTTLHEVHPELASARVTAELVRASTAVIANDQRTFDRCAALSGHKPDHLWWSPSNVIPATPPRAARAGNGHAVVLTFGQISPDKQLETVFEALSRARLTTPLVWRIVGPFDPDRNDYHRSLRERIWAGGGDSWIRFEGGFDRLDDPTLLAHLSRADLAVLLFSDGASPRRGSLQAAWAFGLPVITTSPPADEPAIRDGANCALVGGRDPLSPALAVLVSDLVRDSERAARLREGALATASAYSWDRLVELHLKLYDSVLRQPRS